MSVDPIIAAIHMRMGVLSLRHFPFDNRIKYIWINCIYCGLEIQGQNSNDGDEPDR